MDKSKKGLVEPVKASESFSSLLELKKDLDSTMMKSIEVLKKNTPESADLYARTKTPYSIIKKLVDKRLLDPKKGLQDLIGTTIAVENYDELIKVRNDIRKGILGEVIEEEDMYESPKNGYMAYHYIVSVNNIPVEVQLKTKRMKNLNEIGHQFYKTGTFNVKNALKLAKLTNKADKGDAKAIKQYDSVMKNKEALKKTLQTSSKKAKGGGVDFVNTEGNTEITKIYKADTPKEKKEIASKVKKEYKVKGKVEIDKKAEINYVAIEESDEARKIRIKAEAEAKAKAKAEAKRKAKKVTKKAMGGAVTEEHEKIVGYLITEYNVDIDKATQIANSKKTPKTYKEFKKYISWDKIWSETFNEGGEVITEYDDLPTKVQNALNRDYDEDGDPYDEAKKMQERLNDIGWDMDYDLSGTPTEFWESDKKAKGGTMATGGGINNDTKDEIIELAKGVANKKFTFAFDYSSTILTISTKNYFQNPFLVRTTGGLKVYLETLKDDHAFAKESVNYKEQSKALNKFLRDCRKIARFNVENDLFDDDDWLSQGGAISSSKNGGWGIDLEWWK